MPDARSDLPSGTVTFLFTDVEGSTKLLHELGAEAYAEALAEHRSVIRAACEPTAASRWIRRATRSSSPSRRRRERSRPPRRSPRRSAPGPIQVRIGLHTGTPLLTDEGYIGDDVHFAARVAASGHGGQVILSAATAELVELELTDLGEHRLKDIPEAVAHLPARRRLVPAAEDDLQHEPAAAGELVRGQRRRARGGALRFEDGARLVTLTGPGGTGKTRLAIEAAATLVPEYKAASSGSGWPRSAIRRSSRRRSPRR